MTAQITDYDKVPYESYPYRNTQPEHLYTIAQLFGLDAPNPKKCKVLELGCASGGNIIPMAINFPDSEFVGIDLSKVQIDEGNKHIEKLEIKKNLSLQNISILDINEDFGKFDYIIVHGILSWVPKNVQDKIFEICDRNLTEKGIAYISYNTLPGWNMIKSIREMMLYHTANFAEPAKKTNEARKLLEFIKEGNNKDNNPYYNIIDREIQTLSNTGDSYLAHDHLEENNEPFYFKDFMASANKNNLQYLGETEIATMFVGNLPEGTAKILMQVKDDIVRTEQYMDFIRNRRFRSTLLCHKGVQLNRNLKPEKIGEFYVSSDIKTEKNINEIDLTKEEEVSFTFNNGTNFSTRNKISIAALLHLIGKTQPVHANDLVAEVQKQLGKSVKKEAIQAVLFENLLRLVLAGAVYLHAFPPRYTGHVSEKPKVSKLCRYQATYSNWVTTMRNEKVGIDALGRVLIQYMDGDNNIDAIIENMVKHVVNNDLTLNKQNGEKITDIKEIRENVETIARNNIKNLAPHAILVA